MAVISALQRASVFGQPGRVPRVQVVTPWGIAVQCHELIAPRFAAACQEAHDTVAWTPQRIDSYNPRPIRDTDGDRLEEWSLHSQALAFDFFATPPNVPPPGGVWTPDNGLPADFAAVFERYGFRWGGRWTTRRDVPHIEWADGRPSPLTAAPPTAPPEDDDMADDIIWFSGAGGSHAYRVIGLHGRWLTSDALAAAKFFGVKELNPGHPWEKNVQDMLKLLDGPCKN